MPLCSAVVKIPVERRPSLVAGPPPVQVPADVQDRELIGSPLLVGIAVSGTPGAARFGDRECTADGRSAVVAAAGGAGARRDAGHRVHEGAVAAGAAGARHLLGCPPGAVYLGGHERPVVAGRVVVDAADGAVARRRARQPAGFRPVI